MSLSMYQASVPVFVRQLNAIANVLKKGEAYASAKGIDPKELIDGKLAPDMFALPRQIQIATDAAKGAVARLAGIEVPSFPDTEETFAELEARIAKTVDFIQSVPAEKVDGTEQKQITMKIGGSDMTFTGQQYLLNFAMANFYFHVTTTYAILRNKGVEIGKRDFLGAV